MRSENYQYILTYSAEKGEIINGFYLKKEGAWANAWGPIVSYCTTAENTCFGTGTQTTSMIAHFALDKANVVKIY